MRHFLLARAVAALALGMLEPPGSALLIAPGGATQRLAPGRLRTLLTAVDMAPVAAPADHHLTSTPGTVE
jgi:hypothetical protein